MPPSVQRIFKRSSDSQTSLDVQFADRLTAPDLAAIIGDLVRSLAYQRKQIPLLYDAVKRDVTSAAAAKPDNEVGEDVVGGDEANPRQVAKRRREAMRHKTLGARYLKRAAQFVDAFDDLVTNLETEIAGDTGGNIACVSVMFGSTPVTPKEVYHVYPPNDYGPPQRSSPNPEKSRKRAALQLFRAMITNNTLFDQIGRPMNPTNMFVAVKKRAPAVPKVALTTADGWLVPKPEFSNLKRGSVTEFHLSYRQLKEAKASPPPPTLVAEESLTPIPMDLCTPCEAKKPRITPVRVCASSKKLFKEEGREPAAAAAKLDEWCSMPAPDDGMDETPCVKRTPLYRRSTSAASTIDPAEAVIEMDTGENHHAPKESQIDQEWFVSHQFVKGFKDPRLTTK